jgi:hypothetical protein
MGRRAPHPLFFVSVASTRLRYFVNPLEATLTRILQVLLLKGLQDRINAMMLQAGWALKIGSIINLI